MTTIGLEGKSDTDTEIGEEIGEEIGISLLFFDCLLQFFIRLYPSDVNHKNNVMHSIFVSYLGNELHHQYMKGK